MLPATPPGSYRLLAYVFPYREPDKRLSIYQDGSIRGVTYELARVAVTRPAVISPTSALAMMHSISATAAPGLTLAGYDLPSVEAHSGDRLPLVLYWQSNAPLAPKQLFEVLIDDQTISSQPLVPGYDTDQWQPGDVWRATHSLWIPPALSGGEHSLALRTVPNGDAIALGKIKISLPDRQMNPPATRTKTNFSFGSVAQLSGFDAPATSAAGQPLPVRLVWRAMSESETSYKAFVHVLAADGSLVASNDAIPAAWSRPTNTWLRHEYVVDEHTLNLPANLPPARYTVMVGLYDDLTGERLKLPDGNTTAVLGAFDVK